MPPFLEQSGMAGCSLRVHTPPGIGLFSGASECPLLPYNKTDYWLVSNTQENTIVSFRICYWRCTDDKKNTLNEEKIPSSQSFSLVCHVY